jgi:hypothetical protein
MLQLETQQQFQGFGNGGAPGECYHSQNMVPTPFGFAPFLKNTTVQTSATLSSLSQIRWFAEEAGIPWALEAGFIYSRASGSWALEKDYGGVSSSGNGLILDPTLRLLAMGDRYLAKKDASGTGASWTLTWQDFGTTVTGDKGMDTFRDLVIIPHGNQVGILNVMDDSFNPAALVFPTGCTCIIAKSNKNGILLGVNLGNRSFVALWDGFSNGAITDWLWFDNPLKSICRAGSRGLSAYSGSESGWIVTTTREIMVTDGYTKQTLGIAPDPLLGEILYNPIAGGTFASETKFYLNHTINGTNFGRRQSGTYVLDMETNLWTYVPPSDNCRQAVNMGAIFEDSNARLWLGHANTASGVNCISQLTSAVPQSASIISAPFGIAATKKIAEGAKVELASNNQLQSPGTLNFDISVKVYDFTRPLWTFGTQTGAGAALNQLTVNGTLAGQNDAQIGDEVTILTGLNAGQIRHITDISGQNTSSEVWTLDSNLPNMAANNDQFNVQPFYLVNKFTGVSSIPIDGLYFDVQNKYKGKRFLLKVLLENINSVTALSVASIAFLYSDLGII